MDEPKTPRTLIANIETGEVDINTPERRDFLKRLGKYSAVTSIATVTLMTASKVSALSPPPPPPDEDEGSAGWQ